MEKSAEKDLESRILAKHEYQKKANSKCVVKIFLVLIISLLALYFLIYEIPEWAFNNKYFVALIPVCMFLAIVWFAYTNDQHLKKFAESCPKCGLVFKTYHTGKILKNSKCPRCGQVLE